MRILVTTALLLALIGAAPARGSDPGLIRESPGQGQGGFEPFAYERAVADEHVLSLRIAPRQRVCVRAGGVAEHLGIDRNRVVAVQLLVLETQIDVEAGGRGQANEYDTQDVHEWLMARAVSGARHETARERLERIKGDREELAYAQAMKELVPAALVIWT